MSGSSGSYAASPPSACGSAGTHARRPRTGDLCLKAVDLRKPDIPGLADGDVLLVLDDGAAEDGVVAAKHVLRDVEGACRLGHAAAGHREELVPHILHAMQRAMSTASFLLLTMTAPCLGPHQPRLGSDVALLQPCTTQGQSRMVMQACTAVEHACSAGVEHRSPDRGDGAAPGGRSGSASCLASSSHAARPCQRQTLHWPQTGRACPPARQVACQPRDSSRQEALMPCAGC